MLLRQQHHLREQQFSSRKHLPLAGYTVNICFFRKIHLVSYVHNTAVNIAKFFETKESCSMSGVVEDIGLASISLSK
jgi:hypothetical protein